MGGSCSCSWHENWQLRVQKWPEHVVLWSVYFKMWFAPDWRALFRHRNFQKCLFWSFWLPNLLRTTAACNFWSALTRWLRTRRFSEPTFRPSRATKHQKNTVFRDFTFLRALIFFLLTLSLLASLLTLSLLCLFPLLLHLSEVWPLNPLETYIIYQWTKQYVYICIYVYIYRDLYTNTLPHITSPTRFVSLTF